VINVQLVERVDGTWCAYVEGQEEDAVAAPTDDAALGRLVRGQPQHFGIGTLGVMLLDPRLGPESARNRITGPDSEAPEVHDPSPPGDLV
jgi:hypothetical protein